MEAFGLIALYWGVYLIGYLLASKLRHRAAQFAFLDQGLTVIVILLVCIMGLRMGANEEVIFSLGTIGVQSVLISVAVIGGSILFVTVTRRLCGLNREGVTEAAVIAEKRESAVPEAVRLEETARNEETVGDPLTKERSAEATEKAPEVAKDSSNMRMTVLILCFMAAGMVVGYFLILRQFQVAEAFMAFSDTLLTVGLCMMMTVIGFTMGLSGEIVRSLKHLRLQVVIVPLSALIGSLIGGAVYGLIAPLTVGEGVAVSAGFGWYTLAPGLITEAGHAVAGAVSFLHNVIRETLGIVFIPLAAQKLGYLEAVAIPGVAAMDMCIPIVERSCRAETLLYSFVTGAMMCIAVPVIVPLAIG